MDQTSFGGDFEGLQSKLPYLKSLGFNALYLSSIFQAQAKSEIKEDAIDFRHIDDSLGVAGSVDQLPPETDDPSTWKFSASDRVFLKFLEAAHRQGFRVVIEAAIGLSRLGLSSRQSRNEPQEPQLFEQTRRWIDPNGDGNPSDGIDGWSWRDAKTHRREVWLRWRKRIKAIRPDFLLIGDLGLDDSSAKQQSPFDMSMNGETGEAIVRFFRGHAAYNLTQFIRDLAALRTPHEEDGTYLAMPTPLSTIYAGRFRANIVGHTVTNPSFPMNPGQPPHPRDPKRFSDEDRYRDDLSRLRLAIVFQYFYPGAPMTLYGEEVGMTGAAGPQSRAPMWWADQTDADRHTVWLRGTFHALIHMLNAQRIYRDLLRNGSFQTILLDETKQILAFARRSETKQLILVMNYGLDPQSVTLSIAQAGQRVGILTPQLAPRYPRRRRRDQAFPQEPSEVPRLTMGGGQQFANEWGEVSFWVRPRSVRIVLTGNKNDFE